VAVSSNSLSIKEKIDVRKKPKEMKIKNGIKERIMLRETIMETGENEEKYYTLQ
jgi:hypothetical protein